MQQHLALCLGYINVVLIHALFKWINIKVEMARWKSHAICALELTIIRNGNKIFAVHVVYCVCVDVFIWKPGMLAHKFAICHRNDSIICNLAAICEVRCACGKRYKPSNSESFSNFRKFYECRDSRGYVEGMQKKNKCNFFSFSTHNSNTSVVGFAILRSNKFIACRINRLFIRSNENRQRIEYGEKRYI